MKKYEFRLASVLRVRRIQEEQAKAAVLLANSKVALAKTVVQARKDHYSNYLARQAQQRSLLSSVGEYKAYRNMGKLAAEGIAFSEIQLHEAEEVADVRRTEWAERKQRVQMLERLDDRRREEYRLDLEREMAKEVDDIVVSRFGRKS